MVSRVIPVDVFDLVIFGGTGDLARRKILPGLYRRFVAGQMVAESRIIGAARADLTDEQFREQVREALMEFVPKARQDAGAIAGFLERLSFVSIDATGTGGLGGAEGADARECGARLLFLGRTQPLRRHCAALVRERDR